MKIFMILAIFLLLGAFFIVSNNNLALIEDEGREEFRDKYGQWLAGILDNSRDVTAYVVKLDWLPHE